ncbi:MFS-type transporter SLC18B1 [Eurytemora carolleeae]|uniref:MFS-type transporter SLC18B1 n=1 Tax=Eurytemora carolleeae TaxID=1294199 RepID=UPI000C782CD4|nr:MFS-type transporter SLC18B1 [Eurytemora carolleeae]|eukprot:XP_023323890.1 MFS-type transporter SLC18B1-like [Eurytemora affinis]
MKFRKILNFCLVICVMFLAGLSYTLVTPIFPAEALTRGVSVSESGIVLGSAFVTSLFCIPFSSKLVDVFGAKFSFAIAGILAGFSNFSFGFISNLHHHTSYFLISLILRVLCATGESLITTIAFPLGSAQFDQKHQGKVLAIVESSFSVGMVAGPSIGGLLYNIWGFSIPFWTTGGLTIILSVLGLILMQHKDEIHEETSTLKRTTYKEILGCPSMLSSVFVYLLTGNSFSLYSASMEPYLMKRFGLNPGEIGLLLMGYSLSNAIISPVIGILMDYGLTPLKGILFGNTLIVTALLVLGINGSVPMFGESASVALTSIALLVQGSGTAFITIGSMIQLLGCVTKAGVANTDHTKSMVSSIWLMCWCLSGFIFTTSGSYAYDVLGFPWTCILQAVILCIPLCWMLFKLLSSNTDKQIIFTKLDDSSDSEELAIYEKNCIMAELK